MFQHVNQFSHSQEIISESLELPKRVYSNDTNYRTCMSAVIQVDHLCHRKKCSAVKKISKYQWEMTTVDQSGPIDVKKRTKHSTFCSSWWNHNRDPALMESQCEMFFMILVSEELGNQIVFILAMLYILIEPSKILQKPLESIPELTSGMVCLWALVKEPEKTKNYSYRSACQNTSSQPGLPVVTKHTLKLYS